MCICGRKNCNGLCTKAIGVKAADFIRDFETRNTDIGLSEPESKFSDSRMLTVTGAQLFSGKTGDTRILRPSEKVPKIIYEKVFDGDVLSIIKLIRDSGYTDKDELVAKLNGIYKYKKVAVPIDFGQSIDITITSDEDLQRSKSFVCKCKIASFKWFVDPEDDKLKCYIMAKPEKDGIYTQKRLIEEYGISVNTKTTLISSSDTFGKSLTRMSKFGYIRPLIIKKSDNEYVVIDNRNMYYCHRGNINEIGDWTYGKLNGIDKILDADIKKIVSTYAGYLSMHRELMAPYKLGIANVVDASTYKSSDKNNKGI